MEFEFREARRQLERKRKVEKKERVRMSDAVGGVKHDEGKLLQMKTGSDPLELEKDCHPDIIWNFPKHVLDEADVKLQSRKGTTSMDRELMVQKVQHAEERKGRKGTQFPSIEELKEKAKTAQVDNDKTWKHVDEETAENQQFLEAFWRSSTWSGMRKADLVEQMKKVFENLWDDQKCNQLTKQKLVEMVVQRVVVTQLKALLSL